jgi:D-cysteine desulfhydrase
VDDSGVFRPIVLGLLEESMAVLGESFAIGEVPFLDGYAGRGYALSRPEELETLRLVARTEGVLLDPVYTGKAMHGLLAEIRKGTFAQAKRILFLHTGGLFGAFHFLGNTEAAFGKVK